LQSGTEVPHSCWRLTRQVNGDEETRNASLSRQQKPEPRKIDAEAIDIKV
jgi:hypothetical protein